MNGMNEVNFISNYVDASTRGPNAGIRANFVLEVSYFQRSAHSPDMGKEWEWDSSSIMDKINYRIILCIA